MVNVKGRWALITGAARGIGYLTAKFMAEQGCNLILHSRNIAHTEKVAAEVKAMGVEAYAVQAELSDLDSVKAMLEEIDKERHIQAVIKESRSRYNQYMNNLRHRK